MSQDQNNVEQDADLLCGDALVNFKTIQSFGHEDLIFNLYERSLLPSHKNSKKAHLKVGLTMGFNQFLMYSVISAMFLAGGMIINSSIDEKTGRPTINSRDVFTAIFAIMMGSMQAGNAASFGPDMGKAEAAADRVFKIIEHPSKINAMDDETQIDEGKEFKGKIEFKNVWFRYPTRKEDFVLRGLSITINPSESVALVGESGCGKSTFVNLLMRFYDVDQGEILLDGVNIQHINLHHLRNLVSLVMQEPIIFNYSILENILYGKLKAQNSEVYEAAKISNCLEFIEKKEEAQLQVDSASNLKKVMLDNKEELLKIITEDKWTEELRILDEIID